MLLAKDTFYRTFERDLLDDNVGKGVSELLARSYGYREMHACDDPAVRDLVSEH